MLKLFLISVSISTVWGVALNFPRAICDQYDSNIAINVISGVPSKSKFFQVKGNVPSLIEKLIDNSTTIRENIVDTFSCHNRVYGYYGDQANDCQIFHICVPMQQLFPELYCADDIFHFSFICPKHTIFSQEAMVCDWADNAFPCSEANKLYDRNNLFFVVPEEDVQRESAPASDKPASSPSESLCCSNRQKTIEARSSNIDRFQLTYSLSVTKKSRPTVEDFQTKLPALEVPHTTFPTKATTLPLVEAAEEVTTWPSVNFWPRVFSDSKKSIVANAEPETDSPKAFTIFEGESEQYMSSTSIPETTLLDLTPTESDFSDYYPTFAPTAEPFEHSLVNRHLKNPLF